MSGVKLGTALPAQICVYDTETNGVDIETCRIVTAFIGVMDTASGNIVERWSWLLDIGEDIPQGAIDVHGITNERMREEGMDAAMGVFEIIQRLDALAKRGLPIVVMNAPFDISLTDREQVRHWPGTRPLFEGDWQKPGEIEGEWVAGEPWHHTSQFRMLSPTVFDPMVFDRAISKRAGSRKLVDLAQFYGVPVEANAHDAEADCRMAGRVAIKLLGHSKLADLTMSQVHAKLIPTHRSNQMNLANFWKSGKGLPGKSPEERREAIQSTVESAGHWPLKPRPLQNGVSA